MSDKAIRVGALSFFLLLSIAVFAVSVKAQVAVVNAANFWPTSHPSGNGGTVAPESLASAFGSFKVAAGASSYSASSAILPKVLGGVSVSINGIDADLLYVGSGQINFVVPANIQTGLAQSVVVRNADTSTSSGTVRIEKAMPGVFSADFTGTGIAAANWTPDGTQPYPAVYSYVNGNPVATNVDAGTGSKPSYLILYGTGLRNSADTTPNDPAPGYRNVAESISVSIGGIPARVDYAGKQGAFPGVDQINVVIPPEITSFGLLDIVISANDGGGVRSSNSVNVKFLTQDDQGNKILAPDYLVRAMDINGDSASGFLSYGHGLEQNTKNGKLYFSDVYSITTSAPNTPIAIDLRTSPQASDQIDPMIIVRKLNADGKSQSFYAADDQGGGYGVEAYPVGNNAMLFTVLQDPGQYRIVVTTSDRAPLDSGQYTLTIKPDSFLPITYGQSLLGKLTTADLKTVPGDYVRALWFMGTEGQNIKAVLGSYSYDNICLALRDRNGDEYASDAPYLAYPTINYTLPANSSMPQTRPFILVVAPLEINKTGEYFIDLSLLSGKSVFPGLTGSTQNEQVQTRDRQVNIQPRITSTSAMFRKAVNP